MFELKKRNKPKSLDECVQPDSVVTHLYQWANTVKKWGLFVFVFFAVYGVINGIMLADVAPPREGVWAFVSGFVTEVIYGFLVYATTLCISKLLIALANLVYNTRITANVALLNCEQDITEETNKVEKSAILKNEVPITHEIVKRDYWVCMNCKLKVHATQKRCPKCGGSTKIL